MRNTVRKTLVASLAALTLTAAVIGAASPASAGGWGWHHHHGFWGPGVAFGVIGLAAGAMAASEYGCIRYEPMYDAYGNYVGRRAVNVC